MRHAPDPGQKIDTFDHEQARAHAAEARIKAGGRRSEPSMLSSWRGRPARSRNSRPEQESLARIPLVTSWAKISVIQSTQNTAVFVGRRFGCNERGQSQARQRELGLKRHQLPLPESRASDFPMTHLQASRNTIDSNF